MEDDLDRIAAGDEQRVDWLHRFYFGQNDGKGLHELVSDLGAIDAKEINSIRLDGDSGIVIRVGRYGPYLERDEQRANIPEDLVPDELTVEKARGAARPAVRRPRRSARIPRRAARSSRARAATARTSRRSLEEGSKEKPRTASLFKSMSLDTITLEDALQLLALPRVLGAGADGEEVTVARTAATGRTCSTARRRARSSREEQLLTISLEEALALLAQPQPAPRPRPGEAAAARSSAPIRSRGKPIVVKEGRFGPYVTDGETNASLRQRRRPRVADRRAGASELLADRRARGPAKKPAKKRQGRAKKPRGPQAQVVKSQLSLAAARRRLCPDGLVRARQNHFSGSAGITKPRRTFPLAGGGFAS